MLVAVGRIVKDKELLGVRLFNTDTKEVKDVKIEDTRNLKIKNIKSINKLGIIDNKTNNKPIVILGNKNNKYLTVDINGSTKILNSLEGYSYIDLLTNVEQYDIYMNKLKLMGQEPYFDFEINEKTDEINIEEYIPNDEYYRVIEIPSFVTGIKNDEDYNDVSVSIFNDIAQSLKVIHTNNKMKSMKGLFRGFNGKILDLTNFDTTNVENMSEMFSWCSHLEELSIDKFDTSKVIDMYNMFNWCTSLKKLNINNFDTSSVEDMAFMFNGCKSLLELDLSNFNTSNVTSMSEMFNGCKELCKINLSSFDTSKVKSTFLMFGDCKALKELDLSNFSIGQDTHINKMFEGTDLTYKSTRLIK